MKIKLAIVAGIILVCGVRIAHNFYGPSMSAYVGQEQREIKSLSHNDIHMRPHT